MRRSRKITQCCSECLTVVRMNKQVFCLHRSLRVHTAESGVLNGGLPAASDRAQLQGYLSLFLSFSHTRASTCVIDQNNHTRIKLHWFTVHLVLWLYRVMASNKFNFAVVQNTDLFSIGHCMLRIHLHQPYYCRQIRTQIFTLLVAYKPATLQHR